MQTNIKCFVLYTAREAYRALKKKYSLWYLLAILVLCLLANIAMACFRSVYGMNDGSFSSNLIIFAEGAFVIPYYSCIFLADIVFGPEYPNPHIRDGYTRPLRRFQLYIGKVLGSLIVGVIMFVAAFVLLLVTTLLFGMGDGSIDSFTITDFLLKAAVALPLWIAGISFAYAFLYGSKDKKSAFIGFYVVVLLIPRLIILLASEKIHIPVFTRLVNYLITPQFQALQFYFTMDIKKCVILGLTYSLIATVIGLTCFYKRK